MSQENLLKRRRKQQRPDGFLPDVKPRRRKDPPPRRRGANGLDQLVVPAQQITGPASVLFVGDLSNIEILPLPVRDPLVAIVDVQSSSVPLETVDEPQDAARRQCGFFIRCRSFEMIRWQHQSIRRIRHCTCVLI